MEVIGSPEKNGSSESAVNIDEQEIAAPTINNEIVASLAPDSSEPMKDEIFEPTEKNKEITQPVGQNNTESEIGTPAPFAEESTEAQIAKSPLPGIGNEPAETELSFQPYHTVDYFASQGIKFIAEEKPTDRFGRQLKSFTDWLKTMKRLPQTETAKITDISSDKNVEKMAEHSIDESEVVTETMADVWIKQGNKEKAIEIYHKLSLLNPDKSAYFASLAEQVKNS
jgi:hypothetical protein